MRDKECDKHHKYTYNYDLNALHPYETIIRNSLEQQT